MNIFMLKIIASVTMLIDHTGVLLQYSIDNTLLRAIGRIAFPLYIFMVSEGCRHTRSMKKYFRGFLVFALLSEIIFDMFFSTVNNFLIYETVFFDPSSQNVFFTLALGVLSIWCYNWYKIGGDGRIAFVRLAPLLIIFMAGDLLCTDYGSMGVIMVFLCGVLQNRLYRIIVMAVGFFILYHGQFSPFDIKMMIGASLSLPFMFLYNGKRGYNKFKWIFYVFYPVHILILYLVWHFYVSKIFVF